MSVYDLGKRRRVVRPSPLFLIFVALTAVGGVLAWTQGARGSRAGDFGVFLFVLAGWVVSLCLHEFAHAYAAFRAGDDSVEARGYLSLNPFKYAHPVLSIILPLFFIIQGGIGLPGGAVYLHPHAFRNKRSQSIAAAVGPLTNAIFAAVLLVLAKSHDGEVIAVIQGSSGSGRFWGALAFLGYLQVTAALLNLLPIPGLDGWAIIEPYLDTQTQQSAAKIKPWGMIGVIVLLQIQSVRDAFFNLVGHVYELSGASPFLQAAGYEFFKFWVKNPL